MRLAIFTAKKTIKLPLVLFFFLHDSIYCTSVLPAVSLDKEVQSAAENQTHRTASLFLFFLINFFHFPQPPPCPTDLRLHLSTRFDLTPTDASHSCILHGSTQALRLAAAAAAADAAAPPPRLPFTAILFTSCG